MLNPGEDFPPEGGPSSTTSSTAASSTSSASPSTAAAVTATSSPAPGHQGLSSGAIAGIAIGSCAVVLMAAALFFLLGRQRTLDEVIKNRESFIASGLDMRHASMNGSHRNPYGSGPTPGSISGSNSDATRKYATHREYYDSNGNGNGGGYDPRSSGPEEYLSPLPVAARTYSPGAVGDTSDDGHPNTPRSPPGSVAGGRTSRQSYSSYTPGDDRLHVGRNTTSASRRGPHELFTPLDEDSQYDDQPSAPPSPGHQRPLDGPGPGGEYRY
ncbi:hypothetical protein GP486_008317 [Trichoglossum hirsutum]|uniref:Uncharacterized protein n=1 Tax=Trichoglossum hirsutum TaxID=265104 RepID=A0A9P8IEB4_9PEZI|nr:hypothetical protein GP486_008317 [Trichoglossum hirsutum]